MANTTLTVAATSGVDESMLSMLAGPHDMGSVRFKSFSAVAGTGNYPAAGLTLDLSNLFENKVIAVICTMLYNPTVATDSLGYPVVYVPGTTTANGKLHAFTSGASSAPVKTPTDDNQTITGFTVHGIAIGY